MKGFIFFLKGGFLFRTFGVGVFTPVDFSLCGEFILLSVRGVGASATRKPIRSVFWEG